MNDQFSIRLINESDAAEVLEIYRPYVEDTIISFEYDVPSLDEYLHRIRTTKADYPWLLCVYDNKIAGFAYGSRYRNRTAYQWSAESTVYLAPEFHRRGIARILYETLFELLKFQGYLNVYAGVSLPNEKSVEFHKAMEFEEIGIYKMSGYKFGNWHNTQWFQLFLARHIVNPPTPKSMNEIVNGEAFHLIIATANERVKGIEEVLK